MLPKWPPITWTQTLYGILYNHLDRDCMVYYSDCMLDHWQGLLLSDPTPHGQTGKGECLNSDLSKASI